MPRGRQARLASRLQAAAGRPANGRGGRSGRAAPATGEAAQAQAGIQRQQSLVVSGLRLISQLTIAFFSLQQTEQHPHNHTHNAICNLHLWCQCV
eukprot:COSAG01_NODE_2017_length_8638_cov_15.453917_13_plen_95_part_00